MQNCKQIVVIDGQGGKIGKLVIEKIKSEMNDVEITAIGTNSIATTTMIKAGAVNAATGENPVVVACRTADIIVGPIGIVIADSLSGEITPTMATAIGQSSAKKILIPMNKCNNLVVGAKPLVIGEMADQVVKLIQENVK